MIIYSNRAFTGRLIRDFSLLCFVLLQSSNFTLPSFIALWGATPIPIIGKNHFWCWYKCMRFEYTSNQSTFTSRSFEFVERSVEEKLLIISVKKMHEMSKLSEFWQLSPSKNRSFLYEFLLMLHMQCHWCKVTSWKTRF